MGDAHRPRDTTARRRDRGHAKKNSKSTVKTTGPPRMDDMVHRGVESDTASRYLGHGGLARPTRIVPTLIAACLIASTSCSDAAAHSLTVHSLVLAPFDSGHSARSGGVQRLPTVTRSGAAASTVCVGSPAPVRRVYVASRCKSQPLVSFT